jgi:hypothetical protein
LIGFARCRLGRWFKQAGADGFRQKRIGWIPAIAGMTSQSAQATARQTAAIPAKAGIQCL